MKSAGKNDEALSKVPESACCKGKILGKPGHGLWLCWDQGIMPGKFARAARNLYQPAMLASLNQLARLHVIPVPHLVMLHCRRC